MAVIHANIGTVCTKCKGRFVDMVQSGPHAKLVCNTCGAYITFANREQRNRVWEYYNHHADCKRT